MNLFNLLKDGKKERKASNLARIIKALDKYFDKEINLVSKQENKPNEKIIWQLWFQGENEAPEIIKKCFNSIKKYCKDYQVKVVDLNTIQNYIEIPAFILEKFKENKITNAHFSDYIRTSLLVKYGGIWIDSSVYLTDAIPEKITQQDFFVFKSPIWNDYNDVPDEKLLETFIKIKGSNALYGSSWFIVSKSNNIILKAAKELMEKYWQNEDNLVHYFLYHIFITKLLIKSETCKKIYKNMPAISNELPHILQGKLSKKFDLELFKGIKKLTPIHKLTYKFKNINKDSFLEYIIKNEP